jgi:hypothetical protein
MDDENLTRRAIGALFRYSDTRAMPLWSQPANTSGVRFHDAKAYVVLENTRGVLAVYRVRPNGVLKRLRRWPAALEVA